MLKQNNKTILPTRIKRRDDLKNAVDYLISADNDLAMAAEIAGPVTFKMRPAGFQSLLKIIVEQQLSTASARAIWGRMETKLAPLTPQQMIRHSDTSLRSCGLSGPKMRYCRALSEAIISESLNLSALARSADAKAMAALQSVTGIGRWTAEIYLLFCLGRPDVWPAGDIAVQVALQEVCGLSDRPDHRQMDEIGERWRPLRGVAALILWNYYRHIKNRPVWE